MAQHSKIEWTETTWNPVMGCTPISEGCKNCYARAMMNRFAGCKGWPQTAGTVTLFPERLEQPLHWRKSRLIFLPSMGDLFHEDVPFEFVDLVFLTMTACNGLHTFQVLTKRSRRMLDYFSSRQYYASPQYHAHSLLNVIGMVSVENQEQADKRIPDLLRTPFAVRGVSCEPLLEHVTLGKRCRRCGEYWKSSDLLYSEGDCLTEDCGIDEDLIGIDWLIVGGESGPGARPMHPDWARLLVQQCKATGVPVFVKQMGTVWAKETWSRYDGMTVYQAGDTKGAIKLPEDLQIREMPQE